MSIGLLIFVFILAIFLGVELIAKVPSQLHTPLMSGTNAISGITIVGALTAAGTGADVDHSGFGGQRQLERNLNDQLGFRSRHQRGRIDFEVPPPERARSGEVMRRHSGRPALDPLAIPPLHLGRNLTLRMNPQRDRRFQRDRISAEVHWLTDRPYRLPSQ